MQVNRKNFEKLLPSILKDIKSADFIAIDSEFTGLGVRKSDRNDILDTIQDRYQKVSSVASTYLPIQVGLALFHFSEITKQYVAKPFNFYIFPRTGNKSFGLDRAFQAQVSSIEFLESCGFKWNEWVENGISYVNVEDYERIKFRLNKPNEVDSPLQRGDTLYEYSVEIEDKLKDFLQNSTKKSIDIPTLSGQHKRVVNHLVVRLFNGALACDNKRTMVVVSKQTMEEREANFNNSKNQKLLVELEELVGFRKVIDAISEAKVPIVGHNMYLGELKLTQDLCYFFHNFHKRLPDQVEVFHEQLQTLFPRLYDSKFLAQDNPVIQSSVQNTSLEHLFEVFQTAEFSNKPNIRLDLEFEAYKDAKAHEAGFDAYCTGLIFLRMLAMNDFKKDCAINLNNTNTLNKIYMMNSTMSFININGQTDTPDYSNMFLLTNFPESWKTSDVQQNFKNLGYVIVKWLDDTSCLLILKDKKFIPEALEIVKRPEKKTRKFRLHAFDGTMPNHDNLSNDISRKRKRLSYEDSASSTKKSCIIQ